MPFLDIYLTSVVIDDFHIYRTLIGPSETNSVLIIDADAVLPLAIGLWTAVQSSEFTKQCQYVSLTHAHQLGTRVGTFISGSVYS